MDVELLMDVVTRTWALGGLISARLCRMQVDGQTEQDRADNEIIAVNCMETVDFIKQTFIDKVNNKLQDLHSGARSTFQFGEPKASNPKVYASLVARAANDCTVLL